MDLTSDERDVLLTALFHLRIDHAERPREGVQIEALVVKLGGDPDVVFLRRVCGLSRFSTGTGVSGGCPDEGRLTAPDRA